MTTTKTTQAKSSNPFTALEAPVAFAAHKNPFLTEAPAAQVSGETGYALAASGPSVAASEVEDAGVAAVEVTVLWGQSVLHVEHLTPPRSYFVGEAESEAVKCDFLVPAEKLGSTRAALVEVEGGRAYAVVLPQASGWVEIPGQPRASLEAARESLEPHPSASGAKRLALSAGVKVRMELGDIALQVSSVAAGKKTRRALLGAASGAGLLFAGLSLLGHLSVLGGMAFFKPSLDGADDEAERREHMVQMSQLLQASAEKEPEAKQEDTQTPSDSSTNGGQGEKAKDREGSMGSTTSKATGMHYAVAGRKDNPDPHISREQARAEAATFGLVGLLQAGVGGDPNAPTAPWGRDTAEGRDAFSALGGMWGNALGESAGNGGLGLSGIGLGGGGVGEGIGLDRVGTIGDGRGGVNGSGIGGSHGRPSGEHVVRSPAVRISNPTVSGRIPAEVIQRIVRQSFGRFKMCYQDGLRQNPNLQGRVAVRFVIGRNGAVANVANGGSDLPDANVVSCVVRSFSGLSFPEPDGGIVTVTYPISFAPGS